MEPLHGLKCRGLAYGFVLKVYGSETGARCIGIQLGRARGIAVKGALFMISIMPSYFVVLLGSHEGSYMQRSVQRNLIRNTKLIYFQFFVCITRN